MDKVVLLDLGNVVIGIDFRRVFSTWAAHAEVPEYVFYDGWAMDDAYKEHEIGNIDFAMYAQALSQRFNVTMPLEAWQAGWNDLWTGPFHDVIELLPAVADRYPLYGFTNTNDTHAACWRELFGDKLGHFEDIYVSSEIGVRKPDVHAYHNVCERMSSTPDQVIFLDDSAANIRGAHDAGLDARHVQTEAEVAATLRSLLEQS